MSPCLVFNHHSLPYDRAEHGAEAMGEFLRICIRGHQLGLNFVLVDETVDRNWFRVELAQGYCFQDWHESNKSNEKARDLIRAFRSIATRQPLFSTDDFDKGVLGFDVRLVDSNLSYAALRAAIWHESPLVSFPTRYPWDTSPVKIFCENLNDIGDIQQEDGEITNLYSEKVLDTQEKKLRSLLSSKILKGKELLAEWNKLFPFLIHCGRVREQLSSWYHSPTVMAQVKESLAVLNSCAQQWKASGYGVYSNKHLRDLGLNHEVSGESLTVSNNPALRKQRKFWLPSGTKEYFENHIKLTKGFRIYFLMHHTTHNVYVSYIGKHLDLS